MSVRESKVTVTIDREELRRLLCSRLVARVDVALLFYIVDEIVDRICRRGSVQTEYEYVPDVPTHTEGPYR